LVRRPLEVQTAQHAAAAARQVVLHEARGHAGGGADVLAPALDQVAPVVAEDGGREQQWALHLEAPDGHAARDLLDRRLARLAWAHASPSRPGPPSASNWGLRACQRLTSRDTSSGSATGALALLAGRTSGARREASS